MYSNDFPFLKKRQMLIALGSLPRSQRAELALHMDQVPHVSQPHTFLAQQVYRPCSVQQMGLWEWPSLEGTCVCMHIRLYACTCVSVLFLQRRQPVQTRNAAYVWIFQCLHQFPTCCLQIHIRSGHHHVQAASYGKPSLVSVGLLSVFILFAGSWVSSEKW